MPHQNAPSSAVGYCCCLLISIEKKYEIKDFFTRECCMDPAQNSDTSEMLFLTLCGIPPLASY